MIYDPDDRDRLTGEPKNSYEARIERLEAELADCQEMFARKQGAELKKAMKLLQDAKAELADLRASSVVVRERCTSCQGRGHPVQPTTNDLIRCADCDNGWRLAEGVDYLDGAVGGVYVIPARLIEGDT